jgi:hypothetical protein
MTEDTESVWCSACGKKFDTENAFWKHYCDEIDSKTMGTKYEYTEDPDEWERWISRFLSKTDPNGD